LRSVNWRRRRYRYCDNIVNLKYVSKYSGIESLIWIICLSAGRKHWTRKQYVDQVAVWVFGDSSVGHASRIDMEKVQRRL
jgi:hypothetical protein